MIIVCVTSISECMVSVSAWRSIEILGATIFLPSYCGLPKTCTTGVIILHRTLPTACTTEVIILCSKPLTALCRGDNFACAFPEFPEFLVLIVWYLILFCFDELPLQWLNSVGYVLHDLCCMSSCMPWSWPFECLIVFHMLYVCRLITCRALPH